MRVASITTLHRVMRRKVHPQKLPEIRKLEDTGTTKEENDSDV